MRREDFTATQRAHVVRAERGYLAFVPPHLPPTVAFTPDLIRRLSAADRAIGELAGLVRTLPNPRLLAQTLMRREAVLSSRIEGTQSSLSELVLFEIERPRGDRHADAREVLNYVEAGDHLLAADRRLPLSLPLLLEAHAILMRGGRRGHVAPGEFRRTQSWVGAPGATIETASYVPPPPERLLGCLDPFEKYLHAERTLPPLIDIAVIHYQFEAIHPFLDGNGRVGRLLVVLLLVEWGLLPAAALDLSAYIEPRRDRYYRGLMRVSTEGDWVGWLEFMLDAMEHQARDAARRTGDLQALRDDFRQRVASARASGLLPMLVDELFRVPALSITRARDILGVTHRAATQNVEKLVAAGIVSEVSRGSRQRLFLADEVIATVEGERPTTR